jgi:YYY domain-containing protein
MEYGLVIWWLLASLAFMVAGMPLAAVLFARLPDRGAGVALPLALAVLWVGAYLVGHLSLTAGLWVGLAVLFGGAAVALYRGVRFDNRRLAEVAVVFTAAFLFMIAIRAVDAGAHPIMGEKFLDYGLLRSLLRTDTLPPEDIWFAGQPVQYYYGGHLLAALLTRLTGTAPQYAYNLALALFYGTLVTAAYGLAGSIAATRGVSRVRAGAFGAFFVGFASNLSTAGRFVVWILPDGVASAVADLAGFELERLAADGPGGFWYWSASRVIDGTINEFPLFAWLNGDLHAHMMSAPFVVLVGAVLFSYFRTPPHQLLRRRLQVFGVVPPLAGLLAVVNTWSFPVAGGLVFLTLALSPADPVSLLPTSVTDRLGNREDWRRELDRHGVALAGALGVVLLGVLWTLPFWLGTASTRSIGFLPDRSPMGELLVVHGAFIAVFAVHLVRHAVPEVDPDHRGEVIVMLAVAVLLAWWGTAAAAVAVLGPMVAVGWVLLRIRGPQPAVADRSNDQRGAVPDGSGATGEVVGTTSRNRTATVTPETTGQRLRDTVGFETVLLIAGAGIVVLVEFVFVQEAAGPGRLNTVFKTYADVWVLWAVAAGAMVATLVENHPPALGLSGGRWRPALRAFAVVLVVSTSMYGAFAVSNHVSGAGLNPKDHPEDPTLDALRFVDEDHPDEAAAIAWFDQIEGQPNIVSAPGTGTEMYDWTNPVSSLTGVPTLAGWAHEVGYRGGDVYRTRVDHVETIYTGTVAERAYYLDSYNVAYVYVGAKETQQYTSKELATLESMDAVTLEEEWDYVRVYRVDQDALSYPGQE